MATTSIGAASTVLECMSAAGLNWAFLHGAETLGIGPISDLDVCLERFDRRLVGSFLSELGLAGLSPLVVWPYDTTSAAIFIVSADLLDGVQLDVLLDPAGIGKYGLRTTPALSQASASEGAWPSISAVDSWLYQVRKRHLKGDPDRLNLLLQDQPTATADLEARAETLFSSRHHRLMASLIRGSAGLPVRRRFPTISRTARRLLRPSGVWVHTTTDEAPALAATLGRLLPRVEVQEIRWWNPVHRLPIPSPRPSVRYRAGAVISTGATPFGANVTLYTNDRDLAKKASSRARSHLMLWAKSVCYDDFRSLLTRSEAADSNGAG